MIAVFLIFFVTLVNGNIITDRTLQYFRQNYTDEHEFCRGETNTSTESLVKFLKTGDDDRKLIPYFACMSRKMGIEKMGGKMCPKLLQKLIFKLNSNPYTSAVIANSCVVSNDGSRPSTAYEVLNCILTEQSI